MTGTRSVRRLKRARHVAGARDGASADHRRPGSIARRVDAMEQATTDVGDAKSCQRQHGWSRAVDAPENCAREPKRLRCPRPGCPTSTGMRLTSSSGARLAARELVWTQSAHRGDHDVGHAVLEARTNWYAPLSPRRGPARGPRGEAASSTASTRSLQVEWSRWRMRSPDCRETSLSGRAFPRRGCRRSPGADR